MILANVLSLLLPPVILGVFALIVIIRLFKTILYVCQPNEVLIFSGRTRQADQNVELGYRILRGGRAYRIPFLEVVDRMDLTNMTIELSVKNAYSKGGIPLTVQGVANIKVPGEEPLIRNTLQRFLGRSRADIMEVGRQTLEGNLRGVLAKLTPEQVNQDKEAFAEKLLEEAEHDLSKLGLVLDTLKIQNVSDEVGYLNAIGRMRSAVVRRNAVVAEAGAQAEAAENKWRNMMEGELSKLDANVAVSIKENERRIADARTQREAMIAEERATVQAAIAQATAQVQMQTARIEQVKLQLQADVIQPAEARRRAAEQRAKGNAATIIEQGRATATVLTDLSRTYRAKGDSARDVLLMQKLVPMLERLCEPLAILKVDKLTVLGKGSTESNSLANTLVNVSEQFRAATGVDLAKTLRDRAAGPGSREA